MVCVCVIVFVFGVLTLRFEIVERCWWSERLKPNKPQNLKPVFNWNLTSEPEANVATASNQSHPHLYDWQLKGANESTEGQMGNNDSEAVLSFYVTETD